jgi:hypothetical protein
MIYCLNLSSLSQKHPSILSIPVAIHYNSCRLLSQEVPWSNHSWSANKEHLSDEEADVNAVKKDSLQVLEHDSFRNEEVEANQPILL